MIKRFITLLLPSLIIACTHNTGSLSEYVEVNPDGTITSYKVESGDNENAQVEGQNEGEINQQSEGQANSNIALQEQSAVDCSKFYQLEKSQQKYCLQGYQEADKRVEDIEQDYEKQRFFSIPDDQGLNLNYSNDEVIAARQENQQALAADQNAVLNDLLTRPNIFVLRPKNYLGFDTVDVEHHFVDTFFSDTVVLEWPLDFSFIEKPVEGNQNLAVIEIEEKLDISQYRFETVIQDEYIIPRVFVLDEQAELLGEMVLTSTQYEPETWTKYAKLYWEFDNSLLPKTSAFFAVIPDERKQNFLAQYQSKLYQPVQGEVGKVLATFE